MKKFLKFVVGVAAVAGSVAGVLYFWDKRKADLEEDDFEDDFDDLFDSLIKEGDQYFLLADFESFKKTEDEVFNAYKDKMAWAKKCFLNVCNAGTFSSDRTILQYADEIWGVKRTENK